MSFHSLQQLWCRFWFDRQSPVPLGLFRIVFSLLVLESFIHFASDFSLFYGVNNLIPVDALANLRWKMAPHLDLFICAPSTENWHWLLFCSFVAAAIFLLFGLFTRFAAFWLFLGLVTLETHCPSNYNAGDRYEILVAILLSLSDAGESLAFDSLIRHRFDDWRVTGFAPRLISGWTVRILQVQLALAYCHAFFSKLSGSQWLDGSVIYFVARFHDFHRNTIPAIFDSRLGCKLVAWSTICIEGALATLVWIKELRYWVLLAGVLMHLGIELTMNIPVFEGLFMATYILFIDDGDLTKFMRAVNSWIAKKFGQPTTVSFDGDCAFCVRSVGLLHRLDVFERFILRDFRNASHQTELAELDRQRAEREMMVKTEHGWLGGFRALRWIAWRLPLVFLFAPIAYLPFATIIGDKLYAWIAANRFNFVGGSCSGNVCVTGGSAEKHA